MAAFNKFNAFVLEDLAEKAAQPRSDTLKVMLTNTAPVATQRGQVGHHRDFGRQRLHGRRDAGDAGIVRAVGGDVHAHPQQRDVHSLRRLDRAVPLRGALQRDADGRERAS